MSDKDKIRDKATALLKEAEWKQEFQRAPTQTIHKILIIIGVLVALVGWLVTRLPWGTWATLLGASCTLVYCGVFLKTAIDCKRTDPSNFVLPLFLAVITLALSKGIDQAITGGITDAKIAGVLTNLVDSGVLAEDANDVIAQLKETTGSGILGALEIVKWCVACLLPLSFAGDAYAHSRLEAAPKGAAHEKGRPTE